MLLISTDLEGNDLGVDSLLAPDDLDLSKGDAVQLIMPCSETQASRINSLGGVSYTCPIEGGREVSVGFVVRMRCPVFCVAGIAAKHVERHVLITPASERLKEVLLYVTGKETPEWVEENT